MRFFFTLFFIISIAGYAIHIPDKNPVSVTGKYNPTAVSKAPKKSFCFSKTKNNVHSAIVQNDIVFSPAVKLPKISFSSSLFQTTESLGALHQVVSISFADISNEYLTFFSFFYPKHVFW